VNVEEIEVREEIEVGKASFFDEGSGERIDAGLPVTQTNDPLSGGHFDLGTSKPPLVKLQISGTIHSDDMQRTDPGPSREGGRIVVHGIALSANSGGG
jgi:hypothetical protein